MHHLYIKNVGPIRECKIDIENFSVFTGAQASGKSTIAKAIYFFRTIKEDILDIILRSHSLSNGISLYNAVLRRIRDKFLQIFGSSRAMSNDMLMCYNYNENTHIEITLRLNKGDDYISPNFVFFNFSSNINEFLRRDIFASVFEEPSRESLKKQLDDLFSDDYETIFIPAGRSLITLLTTQLNYIFTIMDEDQKRSIDFCTQKYIERILRIRNAFGDGILGYFDNKRSTSLESINVPLIKKCIKIVDNILKGRYLYVSGEERLVLDNGKFVKINYTSSGQQESVWIFNILLYQMINNIKTFVVLEEPEAHLYPEAQKDITELLAIFLNSGNSVLLTTHSPYILGSVNNLLFAQYVSRSIDKEKVYRIIEEDKIIEHCEPYFVEDGFLSRCFDDENNLIENDVIDGASSAINSVFDRLIELGNEDT